MITRTLLAAMMLGLSTLAFAGEQAPKSDICFTAPAQWDRQIDPEKHLLSLTSPDAGAAVTFTASDNVTGTSEDFHRKAWNTVVRLMKIKTPPTSGQQGEFLKTSAGFEKPDGTPLWICAYSTVKNGRTENFMFFAKSEELYQANIPAVDQMVDGITFALPANESATTSPSAEPAAAEMPSQLSVGVPPGWTSQTDPASHVVIMMPPNVTSPDDAALVVFPAVDFAGTAQQFHEKTRAAAVGQGRLLEPIRPLPGINFQMSGVHLTTAQGAEVWMILYTAHWGNRAQAVLWATARKDLLVSKGADVGAVLRQVAVPGGRAPAQPKEANARGNSPPPSIPTFAPPAAGGADAGDTMPVLEYRDPPNFFRGGGKSFAEYNGSNINFTFCVYPFREFNGDIRATFRQTMLRDWIDVMYREEGVAGQPRVVANTIPGADTVIDSHFNDGRNQEHHRIVIISGHWAAIVDMIAPTAFAYQKGFASALESLKTMHVGRKAAPPSLANGPSPAGAQLAGLYQGMKGKFTVNLMLGPGYGSPKTALHYYLFSADGRVYRCYDFPPGGSENAAQRFDFDAAERQDPGNSGRYTVRGNELYIKMGGSQADEITTTVNDPNTLQLGGVTYQRKP